MKKITGLLLVLTCILTGLIVFIASGKPDLDDIEVRQITTTIEKPVPLSTSKTDSNGINSTPVDKNKKFVVTADVLRVREEPNTESRILGKLTYGTEIKPLEKYSNNWYKISYKGSDGYVSGDFIRDFLPNETTKVAESQFLIVINSKYNTLNIYNDGQLYESYQCATGKKSTPSPEGNFQIVNKFVNPSWKGKVAGGDPSNPLGKRWMGLSVPGTGGSSYGIHGNSDESSIGKNVSGGCIRMHNADVEHVFEYLPLGTEVIISSADDLDVNIAASYGFIIEWWRGAARLLFHF